MPLHNDKDYESELSALRQEILSMAGLVEAMIAAASYALLNHNSEAAKEVVKKDSHVNQAEIDIDGLCLRILALRKPMGPDLRFLTSAMKMVTDLERIGDLAVNLAERAIDLHHSGTHLAIHPGIEGMAKIARTMVSSAIDAFVDQDVSLARSVIDTDDDIDELYRHVFRAVLGTMIQDPTLVHAGIHVQSAAKFLERIGDHATNLAEQVIFMIDGDDLRHSHSLQRPPE